EDGRRCGSKEKIEFQHMIPQARGGKTDVENLKLYCQPHNQLAAEQDFGAAFIEQKRLASDVASALKNLGYSRKEADSGVDLVVNEATGDHAFDALLRAALAKLRRT